MIQNYAANSLSKIGNSEDQRLNTGLLGCSCIGNQLMIFMIPVVTVIQQLLHNPSSTSDHLLSMYYIVYQFLQKQFLHFINELNSIKQVHICFVKV